MEELSRLPDVLKRRILAMAIGQDELRSSATASAMHERLPLESIARDGGAQGNGSLDGKDPACSSAPAAGPPAFDVVTRQLTAQGYAVVDGFMSDDDMQAVMGCAEKALQEEQRHAGMGGSLLPWKDEEIRGDLSRWLHTGTERAADRGPLADLLDVLARLQRHLRANGHDVGGRATFQLACYPGGGARYARHADRSDSAPTRTLTAIAYLNMGWEPQASGGQLCLYCCGGGAGQGSCAPVGWLAGEPAVVVAPLGGRLLVFDSGMEHEVLPSAKHRWAVTAWFHRAQPAPPSTANAREAGGCDEANSAPPVPRTPAPLALPRIFVSIACFRDPECQWTVRDLFLRAAHPDRIYVGIVWQVDPIADAPFTRVAGVRQASAAADVSSRPEAPGMARRLCQVREVRLPYQEATGPCKARALASTLWAGEEYVLQIDAHMRFVPGWDELCIQQLQRAAALLTATALPGARGAVLTTYPPGYDLAGAAGHAPDPPGPPTLLCPTAFDGDGMLRTRGRLLAPGWQGTLQAPSASSPAVPSLQPWGGALAAARQPDDPLPCVGWAAGFTFLPAAALMHHARYPPPDSLPHLFFGEEMYMFARLWTHGYESFSPGVTIVCHQWERAGRPGQGRPEPADKAQLRACSRARVLGTLGIREWLSADSGSLAQVNGAFPRDWAPGGAWGLGTRRALAQLEALSGIRFMKQEVPEAALRGWLPDAAFESACAVDPDTALLMCNATQP